MEGGDAVIPIINGLTVDEQRMASRLDEQLAAKRPRNRLRSDFMDCKHLLTRLPPTIPPYLANVGMVLGWPSKAVEALARRTVLTGFSGADIAQDVIGENDYVFEARAAHLSSLETGVSWLVASRGLDGEPSGMITHQSGLDGTGDWDRRTRRLTSFLSVLDRDQNGSPVEFNLYLPGETIFVKDGEADRVPNSLGWVPVEPLVYRQRDSRPFGSSRISRPIMSLTLSAVRTILRSEGTADFYGTPLLALMGPDQSVFNGNPALKLLMSSMFAIPDNEDSAGSPRAEIKQFTQASQEPHVKQLEIWAQLFAAEANIPVSSLGVGMTQANPTSAESYLASREDLIAEAEDAQDGWSRPHVRTIQNAWMLANDTGDIPDELRHLRPVWRDARHTSKAAAADWMVKVASVMPWIAETDAALDLIGVDDVTAARLRDERAKARGVDVLKSLAAMNGAASGDAKPTVGGPAGTQQPVDPSAE